MIPNTIAHIKATGQDVIGILKFDSVLVDGGWRINEKGRKYWVKSKFMYAPYFESAELINPFSGYSNICVGNRFWFTAYCGKRRLCGTELISELPSEMKRKE